MVLRKLICGGLVASGAILACLAGLSASAQAADIYRGANVPLPAFDDATGRNIGPEGNLEPWSFKDDMDVVKAGVNFKLN